MTETQRLVRREKLVERNAAGFAVIAGIVAVFSGAEPTGSTVTDWVLIAASVGAVVWASASAPWWAPAGAAGVAMAIAMEPVLVLLGALAFAGGLIIGVQRRDQAELRALITAIALNVLIRSELEGFFGLSAIIGITIGVVLFVVGVRRRPAKVRRPAWIATAALGGIVLFAVVVAGLSVLSIRSDLGRGNRQARQGVDLLDAGDHQQAATRFGDASRSFASVDRRLDGPLARLATLLPLVSQNVSAASGLATTASITTAQISASLEQVDADSLRVIDGTIDVDAIRLVEQPLNDVRGSLIELRTAIAEVRSPWLLGRIQTELEELDADIDDRQPLLDNAIEAVRVAPQLLGGDGARRYMVLLASPVEARGLAGFIGNYAIVNIDNGAIDVGEFGRRSELDAAQRAGDARCTGCPPEMLSRYGAFGLDVDDGRFGGNGWTAMTMPAHFPYVGEAAQIMYPQSGGDTLDGVIAMDPHVVQVLMTYTGPIKVSEVGVTVRPKDAADFLLEGQYLLLEDGTNAERVEAIGTLSQQVIDTLLSSTLPAPSRVFRDLAPLVEEHRLLMWTRDPAEQALLEEIGMLGALPPLGDDGGFSVVVTNQGSSKIDAFLDRTVNTAVVASDDGTRMLMADVTLTNDSPAGGLPRYVIGNDFGLPEGTSYLWVSFFGPEGIPTVTRNGQSIEIDAPKPEAGWWASSFDDILGPGETVTYRVQYPLGPALDDVDAPVRWDQPLARRTP